MPDTVIPPVPTDPDFDDLEALMSGTALAAPVIEAAPEPPPVIAPAATGQVPTEAVAAAPPAAEPAVPEGATPVGDEVPPDGKPEKSGIDKRFAELGRKRREAEERERLANRSFNDERGRAERLQRELDAFKAGQPGAGQQAAGTPAAAPGDFDRPRPLLKDYTQPGGKFFKEGEDYDGASQRCIDATGDWRDSKRQFDETRQAATRAAEEQARIFGGDRASAMEEHPDFEDSLGYVVENTPEALQIAISNLPRFSKGKAAWTDVVMYLADKPEELETIKEQFAVNPYAAVAELGRIVHSLKPVAVAVPRAAAAAAGTPPPAPRTPVLTPPVVVGGGSAPAPVDINDDNLSMEAFAREMEKLGIGKPK